MDPGCVEAECCECEGGAPSLDVLQEVQRAYHHRMELVDQLPCTRRMPMQVSVLRQWVEDLSAQNSLLARTVHHLETHAADTILQAHRKHSEVACELRAELAVVRRRLARKDSDLRGLLEVLRRLRDFDYCDLQGIHFFEVTESDIFGSCDWNQKKMAQGDLKQSMKQNCPKMKEIRKLHKELQQCEQTIMHLRCEISLNKCPTPEVPKKDAEVMAGMCCTGAESGDWAPAVKDFNLVLREEMVNYQERIQKMESNLKCSGEDVRALRKVNVGLREELHALRGVCAALGEQARAAALRGQFKDEIIREMRRQLKHAKAKTKEASELMSVKSRASELSPAYERVTIACVRPRHRRGTAAVHSARSLSDDGRSPRLVVSGEDLLSIGGE